jgi:prepilin-type N-terminal cleavage/methylation domain-containing protein
MTTTRIVRRAGYTLLEMTLALAIALIILGAVYEFLNREIALGEIGRDLTESSSLARALLDQMATDVSGNLGGYDPMQATTDGSQAATTQASTATSSSSSSSTTPSSSSTTTPSSSSSTTAQSTATPFNIGVSGTDTCLILTTSRVPRELVAYDKLQLDSTQLSPVSDIRRIAYWFANDGTSAGTGLAKQEVTSATGTDMQTTPPDVSNATSLVIAPEVKNVLFEYFDGSDWQSTWDGTTMSGDGITPIGPPAAIRITLTIRSRDGVRTTDYKHVIALQAGNNFSAQKSGF